MTICEVEPRKLGLIPLGYKLGSEVSIGTDIPVTLTHWGFSHTIFVRVVEHNQVIINTIHPTCDRCIDRTILEGTDINMHPQISKKIRWVP